MILRLSTLACGATLLVGALWASVVAAATVPDGPRLASVAMKETKASERSDDAPPAELSLQTFGPSGERRQIVIRGLEASGKKVVPEPFWGPSWSADGTLIAFTGVSRGGRKIYVVAPDGSGLRPVPGTRGGADPVLSPDGRTVAFTRSRFRSHINFENPVRTRIYTSTTTWVADLGGGGARRLTRWRNGLDNEPSSFSPDGSTLVLTKRDRNLDGPIVVLSRVDGGGSSELVPLAEEASISPDGSRVAFIGYRDLDVVEAEENQDYTAGELYAMNLDGTGMRRLTRTDDVLESAPAWEPSGQRIAYVRARGDTSFVPVFGILFPTGNALMQVNADGTCNRRVLSLPEVAFYGVAWQPGVGREAGPISC